MRLLHIGMLLALALASCGEQAELEAFAPENSLPQAQPIDQALYPKASSEADLSPGERASDATDRVESTASQGSNGGAFDLDPALAAELKPLEELRKGEEEEGIISFSALSLADSDIETLMDHIFPITDDPPPPYSYPEGVQALDGQEVKLVGYMIPLTWKEGEVTELMLVRDLASCCFGGIPRPDEWAFVSFPEGESTEYFAYEPVLVSGTFSLFPLDKSASKAEKSDSEDSSDDEDITAVYSLKAKKIRPY